ncbi:TetR/AcrR family transcriptional regulator [Streptomyces inhibens]|uniref:TetR/AcrR family transcriptional regulator n=1 Tax=Streptomyces inhibens TaxID=2293571 RepID=UPI001EE72801|nr:TetR family transcriptional regulator [Streptomyces inhibens]UKY49211.1 TetR family transcriptional regulator [Streptomyces inhibens]
MARTSGPETREKLIRAAEEIFAAQGVDGARTRDIVRRAGQSNPSAVQYHFGSRAGLLDAVMAGRLARTEAALAPLLEAAEATAALRAPLPETAAPALRELIGALVTAEATELRDDRGRRCLRISAQLSHESGVRTRIPHPTLAGTACWRLIGRVEDALTEAGLPEALRLERLDLALTLIGAALADRAKHHLDGVAPLTGEELFLADLTGTTVAFLLASAPGPAPRPRSS